MTNNVFKNKRDNECNKTSKQMCHPKAKQIPKHLNIKRDTTVANTSAPPKSRDRVWKHRDAIRDPARAITKKQKRSTGSVAFISLTQIGRTSRETNTILKQSGSRDLTKIGIFMTSPATQHNCGQFCKSPDRTDGDCEVGQERVDVCRCCCMSFCHGSQNCVIVHSARLFCLGTPQIQIAQLLTAGSLSGAPGPSDVHSITPSKRQGVHQPQAPSGTCRTFGDLCNLPHCVLIATIYTERGLSFVEKVSCSMQYRGLRPSARKCAQRAW